MRSEYSQLVRADSAVCGAVATVTTMHVSKGKRVKEITAAANAYARMLRGDRADEGMRRTLAGSHASILRSVRLLGAGSKDLREASEALLDLAEVLSEFLS